LSEFAPVVHSAMKCATPLVRSTCPDHLTYCGILRLGFRNKYDIGRVGAKGGRTASDGLNEFGTSFPGLGGAFGATSRREAPGGSAISRRGGRNERHRCGRRSEKPGAAGV
jgi:hypothetical protein